MSPDDLANKRRKVSEFMTANRPQDVHESICLTLWILSLLRDDLIC